ncbi:SurA N-terminal domain-containing protein [Thalassotalea psychrophila]|uniref:Periplasmic chaperone PpiD n=1 Tax=Thalassotalea psychrophila TaxID=3065647 RepID=A0ABY9U0M0_9GAMM|nr:SurA N-terminal domain-containing protein [Colwelliaceae bacterium SQ149]
MLERIREGSSGITAKVILGLVIATFVFAGVGSYTNSVDTSAATVNGEKISQQKFDQAYQNQRNRMEQQYGEMFAQLAGNDMYMQSMRSNVLENLINEELLDQNARELNIRISDQQIKESILAMQEFQVDGVFNNDRYLMVINQAGFYQPSAFRDYLRVDMARRQLMQSIMATEFSMPYQQDLAVKLTNQTRSIRYATIIAEQFKATAEVTDEEINQYYQENQPRFATQEQVKVEYISLDMDNLKKDVVVEDSEVQAYYDDNLSSYSTIERRRASHILIEFGDDDGAAEQQANDILAKVNAGDDFAALAKEFSADTFSGENGGDLDWFEQGAMDVEFDKAVFALTKENNLSEVVKSDFGFHIIKLTDIEEISTKAFADVKAEILEQLTNDQALEVYYDLQTQMAEVAFESPDSLEEAAAVINAEIKTSNWLTRGNNAAPFNSDVVEVAFSDVVLLDNMNSDVVEVAPDQLAMVVRLSEHQDATTKPLTEVSGQIKVQLVNNKASLAAQQASEELLTKVLAGDDVTAELAATGSSFVAADNITRNGAEVSTNVAKQAFTLAHPTEGQVSAASSVMLSGDYAVVELLSVTEGVAGDADANVEQQQAMAVSQAVFEGYIANLKEKAEITRSLPTNASPLL